MILLRRCLKSINIIFNVTNFTILNCVKRQFSCLTFCYDPESGIRIRNSSLCFSLHCSIFSNHTKKFETHFSFGRFSSNIFSPFEFLNLDLDRGPGESGIRENPESGIRASVSHFIFSIHTKKFETHFSFGRFTSNIFSPFEFLNLDLDRGPGESGIRENPESGRIRNANNISKITLVEVCKCGNFV
jgi:hypothetical protein